MMEGDRSASLLVLNNLPSFYRTGPFAELCRTWCDRTGGRAMVVYQARRDTYRRQEWFYTPDEKLPFDHTFLSDTTVKVGGRVTYRPNSGLSILAKFRPTHLLIAGWDTPMAVSAAAYRRLKPSTLMSWIESNPSTSLKTGPAANLYRRKFIRCADVVLVPTRSSAQYAEDLSGVARPTLCLPNPVSLKRIADASTDGMSPRLVFLGDLSQRKGFDVFAEALRLGAGDGWTGVAWGADIECRARMAPANCEVVSGLALNQILPHLRPNDIWAIPSRMDPAPLTFSEAMALGLRAVVSDRIAYADEINGQSGIRVAAAGSAQSLLESAAQVCREPRPCREFGARFSVQHWAHSVVNGLLDPISAIAEAGAGQAASDGGASCHD